MAVEGPTCHSGANVSQLESLHWVTMVAESDRPKADYRVESDLSMLRMDHEIHTVQNLGFTVESVSGVPEHGTRLYVR